MFCLSFLQNEQNSDVLIPMSLSGRLDEPAETRTGASVNLNVLSPVLSSSKGDAEIKSELKFSLLQLSVSGKQKLTYLMFLAKMHHGSRCSLSEGFSCQPV